MKFTLTLNEAADDEVRNSILTPLLAYNESQGARSEWRPLVVQAKNNTNTDVGGLWGHTSYGWLFVELMVVAETLRGQGVGSALLQAAEREAVARGCHGAWLDTFEFQARSFYERMGYICFGEIPNFPNGFSRYFMKKELTGAQQ